MASREKHTVQQLPWDAREKGLRCTLDVVGDAVAHANNLAEGIASGELPTHTTNSSTLTELEIETQLWNLPALLAESSRYIPMITASCWYFLVSSL